MAERIEELMPKGNAALYDNGGDDDDSGDERSPPLRDDDDDSGSDEDGGGGGGGGDDDGDPPTDRYGFYLDATKTTRVISPAEAKRLFAREKSREAKWAKMLNAWGKYGSRQATGARAAKLKRRIRKGVPDALRGQVWAVLWRTERLRAEHAPRRYRQLCRQAEALATPQSAAPPSSSSSSSSSPAAAAKAAAYRSSSSSSSSAAAAPPKCFGQIELDLGRTFPRHAMFAAAAASPEEEEEKGERERGGGRTKNHRPGPKGGSVAPGARGRSGQGVDRLRRVLRAYALYDPEVTYCQGMSFFVAMFLMYRPNLPTPPPAAHEDEEGGEGVDAAEERAFWQLVSVMWRPKAGIRSLFLPDMQAVQRCLGTFRGLCELHVPAVAAHLFETEGVAPSMFATPWYMTVFANAFPFEVVTRVWDAFASEGFKVVHRVALGLLKLSGPRLLLMGFEQAVTFLQRDLPDAFGADAIMDAAFRVPLKGAQIDAIERSSGGDSEK